MNDSKHQVAAPRRTPRARRPAFSLIELLVVLAISAILLGLVITPVVTTFNFTNRARRNVEVQDAARFGMEQVSREIADAMAVAVAAGDTLPFDFYALTGEPGKGQPVVARSTGVIYAYARGGNRVELRHALIDLIVPHDTLGLEGGDVRQPLVPQYVEADGVQHPIIIRYFVGLTHPDRWDPAGHGPEWHNRVITGVSRPANLYTLYRVEFDPYDPRYANWLTPTSVKDADGRPIYRINPNFFYDNTEVSFGGQTHTYAQWWRRKAVALMPTENMDLVDFSLQNPGAPWDASGNPYIAGRSLVTFDAAIMAGDAAAPPDNERRPTSYKTQYGHWTGEQNDGTIPAARYEGALGGIPPRIQVLQQDRDDDGNITLVPRFDSAITATGDPASPASRNRELAWNSRTGVVEFSLPAPDYENSRGGDDGTSVYTPIRSNAGWTPPPGAYITAGSEVVTVWESDPDFPNDVNRRRPVVYSRAASDTKDVYEVPEEIAVINGAPQQLPPPRQYILTDGGRIIIGYPYPSVNNPIQSQPVPDGHLVRIAFFYQNNEPGDLVKVDYLTRELIQVNLTARMYDPVNRQPITTTLANRVHIRNMQR